MNLLLKEIAIKSYESILYISKHISNLHKTNIAYLDVNNNFKPLSQILKEIEKGVSTIPDECKGVELEIGTNSKREAAERWNI